MATDPKPLADSLNRFLANLGAPPTNVLAELGQGWPEIVGPALAEQTTPVQLVNGELLVACTDSAWASQIQWCTAQIKERFKQLYPQVELVSVSTRVKSE